MYAVSASMMLPAAVPVAAAKAPVVSQVKDPFVLHGLNYITAYLYEGDSLQLRSTVPSSKLNRISGSYRWVLHTITSTSVFLSELRYLPIYIRGVGYSQFMLPEPSAVSPRHIRSQRVSHRRQSLTFDFKDVS